MLFLIMTRINDFQGDLNDTSEHSVTKKAYASLTLCIVTYLVKLTSMMRFTVGQRIARPLEKHELLQSTDSSPLERSSFRRGKSLCWGNTVVGTGVHLAG